MDDIENTWAGHFPMKVKLAWKLLKQTFKGLFCVKVSECYLVDMFIVLYATLHVRCDIALVCTFQSELLWYSAIAK